jgi:hypothetical protein
MIFIDTQLFKYLQNHSVYKIFCDDNEITKFFNKNNILKNVPNKDYFYSRLDLYIEIVSEPTNAIFVNIWYDNYGLIYRYYSLDYNYRKDINDSNLFCMYPTLSLLKYFVDIMLAYTITTK